jgi:hypothetical protein
MPSQILPFLKTARQYPLHSAQCMGEGASKEIPNRRNSTGVGVLAVSRKYLDTSWRGRSFVVRVCLVTGTRQATEERWPAPRLTGVSGYLLDTILEPVPMPVPSITVITPVRNGITHLRETIECVMAQRYAALEMIVIDDGSADGSGALARSTGSCRVIETPPIGPAAARNAGIRASKSDLLFFLDADDLLGPLTFDSSVEALLRAPDAGFAQGYVRNFTARPDGSIHIFTPPYRFINIGSGLWRRSVFETVGLFDESLRYCEDLDFFMRCWERDISKVLIDRLILLYRRHSGNMTRGLKGAGFGTLGAYRRRIERIRRGEYDPNSPRLVAWPEYFGRGPDIMDLD